VRCEGELRCWSAAALECAVARESAGVAEGEAVAASGQRLSGHAGLQRAGPQAASGHAGCGGSASCEWLCRLRAVSGHRGCELTPGPLVFCEWARRSAACRRLEVTVLSITHAPPPTNLQIEVQTESEAMIPDTMRRLEAAVEDLREVVVSAQAGRVSRGISMRGLYGHRHVSRASNFAHPTLPLRAGDSLGGAGGQPAARSSAQAPRQPARERRGGRGSRREDLSAYRARVKVCVKCPPAPPLCLLAPVPWPLSALRRRPCAA